MSAPADPLERHLLEVCRAGLAAGRRPVLGLNGPVGSGKSTLARRLQQVAAGAGLQLAVASIDDAYLPWPQRQQGLRGNPFGVSRVPPGSHDPAALLEPIRAWRSAGPAPQTLLPAPLRLPRFDKCLRDGEGDRGPDWQGQAHGLLLEGWLIGCRPQPRQRLLPGDPALLAWRLRCNQALAAYAPLWEALDQLVVLWPASWQWPRRWRLQAEARQRRVGGGWLTAAALERMVQATLASLPPDVHQRELLDRADWVRLLDGRRRIRWQGAGDAWRAGGAQSSSDCSSATGYTKP